MVDGLGPRATTLSLDPIDHNPIMILENWIVEND